MSNREKEGEKERRGKERKTMRISHASVLRVLCDTSLPGTSFFPFFTFFFFFCMHVGFFFFFNLPQLFISSLYPVPSIHQSVNDV